MAGIKLDAKLRQLLTSIGSQIIKQKRELVGAINGIPGNVFKVKVENDNANLLKEIAQNTRGVKGKLDTIDNNQLKKVEIDIPKPRESVSVSNLDSIKIPASVTVDNLGDIKYPTVEIPTEITVKNLKDIPKTEIKTEKVDFTQIETALNRLNSVVSNVYGYLPKLKPKEIKFPAQKAVKIPDKVSLKESEQIIKSFVDGLQGVRDDLSKVHEVIDEKDFGGGGSGQVAVSGSAGVSSVHVNALRGIAKTAAVTVGTSAVLLPTSSLKHRRSLIIYNNSSNEVYIGGEDLTTANGLPIAAESYSPPIDAGESMRIYAIAGSNSNVRVLEVSSEREGA